MTAPTTVTRPDRSSLSRHAAEEWVTFVTKVQRDRGLAHVVLTGGSMGDALLSAIASSPRRDAVDWGRLVLWWGDERFLPAGHPDRNAEQARVALLDAVPLDPGNVHPMPASDGPDGDDVDAAARRYADQLAAAADAPAQTPVFDLVVLGVGPDGHVASLFPGQPALEETRRSVVAVRDSPKPPPTRITMTFPALRSARHVWLLVCGDDKAEAVSRCRSGLPAEVAPGGGVSGREATVWWLDEAAAGDLDLPVDAG